MDSKNKENLDAHINTLGANMRDLADKDYILSRFCYFDAFHEGFFWHAQQSLEKYFKAMGIFRRVSTKKHGHDLKKLYKALKEKEFIKICDSKWEESLKEYKFAHKDQKIEDFLERIKNLGLSARYHPSSYHSLGDELLKLDLFISLARKYCVNDHSLKIVHVKGSERVSSGYLEKITNKNALKYSKEKENYLLKQNGFFPKTKKVSLSYKLNIQKSAIDLMKEYSYPDELKREFYSFVLENLKLDRETENTLKKYIKEIELKNKK